MFQETQIAPPNSSAVPRTSISSSRTTPCRNDPASISPESCAVYVRHFECSSSPAQYSSSGKLDQMQAYGWRFLTKPFSLPQLLAEVHSILETRLCEESSANLGDSSATLIA